MENPQKHDPPDLEIMSPIVVNMGKQPKKWIRRLYRGQGKLVDEVENAILESSKVLEYDLQGKTLVPIVLVYTQKRKRRGLFNRS